MDGVSAAGAELPQVSSRRVPPVALGLEAAAGIDAEEATAGGGAGRPIGTGGDNAGGDSAKGVETAGEASGSAAVIGGGGGGRAATEDAPAAEAGRDDAAAEGGRDVGREVGSPTLSAVGSMLRGTWMRRVAGWMHGAAAWMHGACSLGARGCSLGAQGCRLGAWGSSRVGRHVVIFRRRVGSRPRAFRRRCGRRARRGGGRRCLLRHAAVCTELSRGRDLGAEVTLPRLLE